MARDRNCKSGMVEDLQLILEFVGFLVAWQVKKLPDSAKGLLLHGHVKTPVLNVLSIRQSRVVCLLLAGQAWFKRFQETAVVKAATFYGLKAGQVLYLEPRCTALQLSTVGSESLASPPHAAPQQRSMPVCPQIILF
eukprot:4820484-Amphidinium_carterae.1